MDAVNKMTTASVLQPEYDARIMQMPGPTEAVEEVRS